jgi:hypothetical protein
MDQLHNSRCGQAKVWIVVFVRQNEAAETKNSNPINMNTIRKFHRVNPEQEAARAVAQEKELHGIQYSLFCEGVYPFEFKSPKSFVRLLPQPEDALNSWSVTVPYIYLDPNTTPGHRGYLALTTSQATLVDNARRALYSNPEFSPMMACETNRNGISLSLKYRGIFMGFDHADPDPRVMPISLPSSGFRPKSKKPLQAATVLNGYMLEKDSAGESKYGDIVDLDSGRLIVIEILGMSKDRREYVVSVDRVYPIGAELEHLLAQIRKFEDLLSYQPDSVVYEILRLRLTPEMWAYISQKLQIGLPLPTAVPKAEAVAA